ncbi:unnamed protein product [Cylindrotheca closterium]|uniref:Uncharacterized protein n=1 Tax=Cylindrotheca closterium TaxID=2856 RepID=A0AAD2PWN2_9STRA|nr:unnamed protein product [Cylindrotheca closterium]
MGIIDKRRTRRRDLLLRNSSSSSSMLVTKTDGKTILNDRPQEPDHHNSTFDQDHSHHPTKVESMRTLLMNKSEDGGIIGSEIFCIEKIGEKVPPVSKAPTSQVTFSSVYTSIYIPRRTEAEKVSSFYSQEDYDRIKSDTVDTITEMETEKKYPSSETQYHRGLLTPRAKYEKEQRIKFVVSKVLREQERNKCLSEDWVNTFSKKYSSQTTTAAFFLGKIDAKAAGAPDTLSSHSYIRCLQRPNAPRRAAYHSTRNIDAKVTDTLWSHPRTLRKQSSTQSLRTQSSTHSQQTPKASRRATYHGVPLVWV